MSGFKSLALALVAGFACTTTIPTTQAQINITIGAAPDCPYGYYDVAPYSCAPYGYYGPEWFTGGVFIGAGQWFHGPANFNGQVDNRFDPQQGYKGPAPKVGDKAEPSKSLDKVTNFKGNEVRDGRGNATGGKH
jgi:hypothetical protein